MWGVIMRTRYSLWTDRWTDEQTQATTIPHLPERPMGKNDPIAAKKYISIEPKASSMTIRFHVGYDLDLEFSRSNMEFAIPQPKMVRLPRNEKQTYWLNPMPQMLPLGLTLNMTLKGEVTGVTSDVGVPSTRPVYIGPTPRRHYRKSWAI